MRQPHLGVLAAALIAPVVATLWVWLTARTGLTFHFYPLLIALAPSFVVTRLVRVSVSRPAGMGLVAAGIAAVATGWLTLGVLGARPAATFVEGQWGGVGFEVISFTVVGALLAARLLRRVA